MEPIGNRYGRLVVIEETEKVKHNCGTTRRRVIARCDCGTVKTFNLTQLTTGRAKSCGCLGREMASERLKKLRAKQTGYDSPISGTPTYRSWASMMQRCKDPKNKSFNNYGGRGIKVCDRWMNYRKFEEDMGERPAGKTLDRINSNGNYEPGNCRWASIRVQNNNQRNRGGCRAILVELIEALTESEQVAPELAPIINRAMQVLGYD